MHLLQTLLATPMWLKLAVILAGGLLYAFPVALRWLIGTEPGRAVTLGVAAIVAVCLFRAEAFTAGRAAERAATQQREQARALAAAKRELALTAAARDAERRHAAALLQLDARHAKELADATTARDRTIADLRSGALRLRREWTCPTDGAAATAADPGGAVDAAELRRQGAADLVRLLDEADADIRYWQDVARADRALSGTD